MTPSDAFGTVDGLDWDDVRRRVAAMTRDATAGSTPERDREILEERARALARPATAPERTDALEVVTFTVARERYAVESRHVIATFRVAAITPVPGARAPVAGVTAWRGDVLTLLDLRRIVGASATGLDDLGRVVVLGGAQLTLLTLGVLADVVHGVSRLALDEVLPVPTARARVAHAPSLLRGITRDATLLLDAAALLAGQSDTTAPLPASNG